MRWSTALLYANVFVWVCIIVCTPSPPPPPPPLHSPLLPPYLSDQRSNVKKIKAAGRPPAPNGELIHSVDVWALFIQHSQESAAEASLSLPLGSGVGGGGGMRGEGRLMHNKRLTLFNNYAITNLPALDQSPRSCLFHRSWVQPKNWGGEFTLNTWRAAH